MNMKSDKSKGRFRQAFTREKIIRFIDKQGFMWFCSFASLIGVTAFLLRIKVPNPRFRTWLTMTSCTLLEPTMPDGLDTVGLQDERSA